MGKCKICGLKTHLSEDDIQKMIDEVISMKGIRLADEDVYKSRYDACMECDNLMYGSTCSQCGCIIQVRARLADGRCPKKKWNL